MGTVAEEGICTRYTPSPPLNRPPLPILLLLLLPLLFLTFISFLSPAHLPPPGGFSKAAYLNLFILVDRAVSCLSLWSVLMRSHLNQGPMSVHRPILQIALYAKVSCATPALTCNFLRWSHACGMDRQPETVLTRHSRLLIQEIRCADAAS